MKKYSTIVTAVDCDINPQKGVCKINRGGKVIIYATMKEVTEAWNYSFEWIMRNNPNYKKMTVTVNLE